MKKVPNVFVRDWEGDRTKVLNQYEPECMWVGAGQGVATKKFDGTAVLIARYFPNSLVSPALGDRLAKDGVKYSLKYFKRYDAKNGKTPPANFLPAQPEGDPVTGHWPGWVPIDGAAPQDARHAEAITALQNSARFVYQIIPGTYELCGPKVNGNPENLTSHLLIRHGKVRYPNFPRSYEGIRDMLVSLNIEGVVFWRYPELASNDDRQQMAKIRLADFGLKRKEKA